MLWFQVAIQWLHVLGGIFWFGSTLFVSLIHAPAMMSLPPRTTEPVFRATTKRARVVLETVGAITVLLGIIRGTLLGPVQSVQFLLGTPSAGMLLGLTYQLIRFVADLVLVGTRSNAQLRTEVLALRHPRAQSRQARLAAW